MGRLDRPVQRATYERAFKESVAALRDADVPFACMGSLALWARGGPLPNLQQDLDYAICEEDAPRAAKALRDAGFHVQVPEEDWLVKAWTGQPHGEDSALIDLIFLPAGLVITPELLAECEHRNVLALDVPVLGATDLLVTKLASVNELDANFSSVLQFARSLREQLDWKQVDERIGHVPFGEAFIVLARRLGLTGEPDQVASQVTVPRQRREGVDHRACRGALVQVAGGMGQGSGDEQLGSQLRQALAADPRSGDLDVDVHIDASRVLLRGIVDTEVHRDHVGLVTREALPAGFHLDNRLEVRSYPEPERVEELS